MITIETNRLLLRNYRLTDFEDIFKYFSDEEVSKFEDFDPMSEEQVRNMITEWQDMDNRLVAELKSKQNVIGSIGYWVDDVGHYCIDYDFNPQYYGQGYAQEAGNAFVHYLFESVGISALTAIVMYGMYHHGNFSLPPWMGRIPGECLTLRQGMRELSKKFLIFL